MHIIINGNYLSLNNILAVGSIITDKNSPNFNSFGIMYHCNESILFYHKPACPENGELVYSAFYFKDEKEFINIREQIIKILTENAAKSN